MLLIRYPEDEGIIFRQFTYPAGERQVRILEGKVQDVAGAVKIWVQAKIRNAEDLMALCLLTSAIDGIVPGSKVRDLILPYLPYSRADRRFLKGDCYGLETFASIINTLGYSRVTTLDAHSDKGSWVIRNLNNVSAKPLIDRAFSNIMNRSVILLPDEGASRYGLKDALYCEKEREPVTGKLFGFRVPPAASFRDYETILIVDDICDAGGTFIGIAEALGRAGIDLPIYLYVTHGIFSKGTEVLLKHFKGIFTSDSFDGEFENVLRMETLSYLL